MFGVFECPANKDGILNKHQPGSIMSSFKIGYWFRKPTWIHPQRKCAKTFATWTSSMLMPVEIDMLFWGILSVEDPQPHYHQQLKSS